MTELHPCYRHISWGKQNANSNLHYYIGTDTNGTQYQLTNGSTTKDFQNSIFKQGAHWTQDARGTNKCPVIKPCYNGETSQIEV